jgi:hypothetical protein
MGRSQHSVRNSSSEPDLRAESRLPLEDDAARSRVRFHSRGGRDDEQARQSGAVALESRGRGISLITGAPWGVRVRDCG